MIKKNLVILSLLVMSLMVVGVSAAGASPKFTNPLSDAYVSGDMLVEWTNPLNIPLLYVMYKEGACTPDGTWAQLGPFSASVTETTIDTLGLDDVEHCLRLIGSGIPPYNFLQFNVDNEDPEINVFTVTQDGKESDSISPSTRTEVLIDADDNVAITECEIDWGDEKTKDCSGNTQKTYNQQYKDEGKYKIILTVKDKAGNTETAAE